MNHHYKKMKMWRSFSVLMLCLLWGQGVWGQFTIASDNAGNYGGIWNSNQGTGFSTWTYIANGGSGGFAGRFIGDPSSAGISGMNSSSFALFANPNVNGNESKASRSFSGGALQFGDTFSFQMGMNFDSNNGNGFKGIDLRSSSAVVLNFNMANSSTITWGRPGAGSGGNLFTTYGTQAMNFQITKVGVNQYRIVATPRAGSTNFDETHTLAGEISAFEFYAGRLDPGDQRQPYYNNLTITNSGVFAIASGTETYSRSLSGSGNLSKSGNGTLQLTGDNTYTGTTTVTGGTLQLNATSGNTLGNSAVTVNGGTLRVSTNQTLANLTLSAGGLTIDAGATLTLTGNVTLPNGFTITNNGTLVIEGTLTDNRASKSFDGTVRYAASSGSQTVVGGNYANLELSGASSKSFDADTQIGGNFTVSGGAVTPPSTITFSGASAQNIAGLAYNNIEFSGAGAKTFTSNASVSPTSAITFGTGGATIDFDGTSNNLEFVLQSTSSGTARIGNATGWTLSGQVRAERFVQSKRAWRLITSPLVGNSNNSVNTNWQNTGTGTGLLLWNPQAEQGSGMVTGTGIANIYRFGNPNTGWNAVSNTINEELFNDVTNHSFLVFATGPSNETNVSAAAQATTLRPRGNVRTGNVSHSINANTNRLLGNPYASALDLSALKSDSDHSAFPTFWLLDPILNVFGGYVTFDGADFVPNTNGTDTYTTLNTRIESGQAFFVRPNANTSFIFKESHKIGNGSHSMLRQNTMNQDFNSGIRVNLYKTIEDSFTIVDGILARFNQNESNDITETDSRKFGNTNENIMFRTQNTSLSIDKRSLPTLEDELSIRMTNTTANTVYQIRAFVESFENIPYQAFLLDTQTQQLTAIPMDGTSIIYPFTAMAATNAQPDDRFKIVFQDAPLSNDVAQQPILSLYPNPIHNGIVFLTLDSSSSDLTLEITNVQGQKIMNPVAENIGNGQFRADLSSLSPGIYLLKASDSINQWMHKIAVH